MLQLCQTLGDPMGCSLPRGPWTFPGNNMGVGCHFLFQEISQLRDWTHISCVSCNGRRILYHCTTWESLYCLYCCVCTCVSSASRGRASPFLLIPASSVGLLIIVVAQGNVSLRHYIVSFVLIQLIDQCFWIEFSEIMEMICVCVVQYKSHWL